MRQKATLVHDSTRKVLLDRVTQDPDICFKGKLKEKNLTGGNQKAENSAVKWTKPAGKCLTAAGKVDTAHARVFQ